MAATMSAGHNVSSFTQEQLIDTTPERIFEVLLDPAYVPEYAAGIEGASITEQPDPESPLGSKLELLTSRGNLLKATVVEFEPPHHLAIEDERGTNSRWEVQQQGNGRILLRNTITGKLPPAQMDSLRYDADIKFQALTTALEGIDDDATREDSTDPDAKVL